MSFPKYTSPIPAQRVSQSTEVGTILTKKIRRNRILRIALKSLECLDSWLGLSFDGIEIGDGTAFLLRTSEYQLRSCLGSGAARSPIWHLKGIYNLPSSYFL